MKINFTCNHCNKEYPWEYDTYVNVSENPQFKEDIMEGKAFAPVCPHCGAVQVVQYSLLYVDPDKKLAIAMYPRADRDISTEAEKPAEKVQEILNMGDYTMRLVENSNDLAEKIIIGDSPYDDRLVEMMKVYYYDAMHQQLVKENTQLSDMLFGNENDKPNFWIRLMDGRTMSLDMEMDMYNDIKKDVESILDEKTQEGFAIVNTNWAYNVLQAKK